MNSPLAKVCRIKDSKDTLSIRNKVPAQFPFHMTHPNFWLDLFHLKDPNFVLWLRIKLELISKAKQLLLKGEITKYFRPLAEGKTTKVTG